MAQSLMRSNSHKTILTLTAVQANLQVTEDSSLSVFCNKGMQSTKEKEFPKKRNKNRHHQEWD